MDEQVLENLRAVRDEVGRAVTYRRATSVGVRDGSTGGRSVTYSDVEVTAVRDTRTSRRGAPSASGSAASIQGATIAAGAYIALAEDLEDGGAAFAPRAQVDQIVDGGVVMDITSVEEHADGLAWRMNVGRMA